MAHDSLPSTRLQGLAGLAVALVVWFFPSKAIQDVLLWCAFLYAVYRHRGFPRIWRTFPGCMAVASLLLAVLSTPLSVSPVVTLRSLAKASDAVAALYAVPILLGRRQDIERALLWSGVAFSCVMTLDLARILWFLGPQAVGKAAHEFEPFMVTHSNISAVLAALGFFIMAFFALRWRAQRCRAAACFLAATANLAYLVVIASRGPQIAFAAALAGSGFLARRWSYRAAWLMVVVLLGVMVYANLGRICPRFAEKQSLKTFVDRDKVWRHTWRLAKERPVLGHGFGKRIFMETYHGSNPPSSPFHFEHPHQYWLYVFFAQGTVGVLIQLVLWAGVVWRLLRETFRTRPEGDPAPVAALILVLCAFFLVYSLADWPSGVLHLFMAWLVTAALVATKEPTSATGNRVPVVD